MQNGHIFIVGQVDTHGATEDAIRKLGYNVGLFHDQSLPLSHPERFDIIVELDFSNLDQELSKISDLDIRGLQCTYENYIVAKAKIGEYLNLPAPSVTSAQLSTNKALMRQAFLDYDSSISPSYAKVATLEDALAFANTYGYPLIIKPTSLVKSLLVLKCDNEQQLRERFTYAKENIEMLYKKYKIYERASELIIEEFIEGDQYSIAAFVDAKGEPHFCQGIVALKNAQDIGVDDNYIYSRRLPTNLDESAENDMFKVAAKGIKALDMKSVPAHVELMHGPKGTKIIEIGARIGGYRPRMYSYSYGLDLLMQEINLSVDAPLHLDGAFSQYSAVYELFPEAEGVFDSISNAPESDTLTYYRVTKKPGDIVGPSKNGHKATAIVIATSESLSDFTSKCQKIERMSVKIRPNV
jgi:biotin carboxylase